MEKFNTVDEYMAALPPDFKPLLEKIRQTIKELAPNANEVISYGMPGYKYHGMLVYFAAFKNHCSFFVASHAVHAQFAAELAPFKTSKGTLQFTPAKPIPMPLLKKSVKARLKENELKAAAKLAKKN